MKVLILVPGGLDRAAGKYIPVLDGILAGLGRRAEIAVVVIGQYDDYREYRLGEIPVVSIPANGRGVWLRAALIATRYCHRQGFRPDVVHSISLGAAGIAALALATFYRRPLVVSSFGGELVELREIGYGGLLSRRSSCKSLLAVRRAEHHTLGSVYLQEKISSRFDLATEVLPLGIDLAYWSLLEPRPIEDVSRLIVVASINRVKNPHLVLSVCQLLKKQGFEFELTWIGVDTLNGEIACRAGELGLADKIHFIGYQDIDEIRQQLQDHHFVIQASLFESQGVAVAECVSQGLCPVGTGVGWLHDMGVGVPPEDAELTRKIADEIRQLSRDFETRADRVRKLQAYLVENDVNSCVGRFVEIYTELARSRTLR